MPLVQGSAAALGVGYTALSEHLRFCKRRQKSSDKFAELAGCIDRGWHGTRVDRHILPWVTDRAGVEVHVDVRDGVAVDVVVHLDRAGYGLERPRDLPDVAHVGGRF